jgi:hypothetical protein
MHVPETLLVLLFIGCAAPSPRLPSAARETKGEALSPSWKGKAVRVVVKDHRASLEDSTRLVRAIEQIATERLRATGAAVSSDAATALVLEVHDFGQRYQGSTNMSCVKLAGRIGLEVTSFLPTQTFSDRCVGPGTGENPIDMGNWSSGYLAAGAAVYSALKSVQATRDNPPLTQAFRIAFEDVLNRLSRHPWPSSP